MTTQLFVLFTLFVLSYGDIEKPMTVSEHHLLGLKECTWGPSYWCRNITTAGSCSAAKHCIQTVWMHKQLPIDNSDVCQTCMDMVKQARDQLESNETQELIKEVFDGSCKLLLVKPIVKECCKVADDWIPELVDALASQMNPQVVCAIAGLCNTDRWQKLIASENNKKNTETATTTTITPDTCEGCHIVVDMIEKKFNKMSRDQLLDGLLLICRKTGSLSDACSNTVITYFTEIYNHLKDNLNPTDVCLMSGECSAQFHQHANVEITPISHIGYVPVGKERNDDLPCELCEQLIHHLRDLLIANTTRDEFKDVLKGLCEQATSFKDECLSLVDEYYGVIYDSLVAELDANAVCGMIGICQNYTKENEPIMPLISIETVPKLRQIVELTDTPLPRIALTKNEMSVKILTPETAQLPIDLLIAPHTQVMYSPALCSFCEYLLHFLQQVITSPANGDKIRDALDTVCDRLPRSVIATCVEFIDIYEEPLIAILAQEMDPSTVCPMMRVCKSSNSKDVEVFMQKKIGSDGKCPLCLLAITSLENSIKDKKTEENIVRALTKLCSHLSNNVRLECEDFVKTYTDELVNMLMSDFTPDEVCEALKLCHDPKRPSDDMNILIGGDIETNMIPDDTVNGVEIVNPRKDKQLPQCAICRFVMEKIQKEMKMEKNEDEIKRIVHNICNMMPDKRISKDCNGFVNKYADQIIQLLIAATIPDEICPMLGLCTSHEGELGNF